MSELIAGVDEAGVCPIAGPVVAAAVILNPAQQIYPARRKTSPFMAEI